MKYIMLILVTTFFVFESLFSIQMLQQNSYNEKNRFFLFILRYIKENLNYCALKLLFGISLVLFSNFEFILYVYFFLIMFILIYSSILQYKKYNKKLPLKFTKRVIRILSLNMVFYFAVLIILFNNSPTFLLGVLISYITLLPFALILINYLLFPIEKIIYEVYKIKAIKRLNKMKNINVIGITGSFGKTSTKMILNDILSIKYKGFATASSFNTPKGITKTINETESIFNDYFIAEMGARAKGEIKELCDIVHPKYGIITSVGPAHLDTFKNIENITKTKCELLESLPSNGVIVLNKDNEYLRKYKPINKVKTLWFSLYDKKADAYASDIKYSEKGSTFTLHIKNKSIQVETSLLGKENIYNIVSAALLANELGLSLKEIQNGILNIKAISHRLELKKIGNITIIDDSYNSNPVGSENAIEVLKLMKGKKVIITPGMVEMGKDEERINYEFGIKMAGVCDRFYLIGKKRSKSIKKGILECNEKADIKVFNSFNDAYNDFRKDFAKTKVTVLLENDLPDTYTEN